MLTCDRCKLSEKELRESCPESLIRTYMAGSVAMYDPFLPGTGTRDERFEIELCTDCAVIFNKLIRETAETMTDTKFPS